MSSFDFDAEPIVTAIDQDMNRVLAAVGERMQKALANPDTVSDRAFQDMLCKAIKLYARKAEMGLADPFPPRSGDLTATDVMLTVTDMLHALNVQLFELSMWQAMTGNCIAPHQRAAE